MRTGLVLEGGAMRGMFTAGVIDTMMQAGLRFDGIVGVSAGAAFGCNYKSHQIGRALRYNQLMAHEWRYCSLRSLLLTGDLFGAEYAYHYVPTEVDIFDCAAYAADPMEYHVVATDVVTGKAVYRQLPTIDYNALEWIRASASMPLCSRVVQLDGYRLLDGGVADSIPLKYFEGIGYGRNIVVLTQPLGYRKSPNRFMPLMRLSLRRYPRMIEALAHRHVMYNAQLDYVAEAERTGRVVVIRPPEPLPIGHLCHDPRQMRRVYDIGCATAHEHLCEMRSFLDRQGSVSEEPLPQPSHERTRTRVLVGFMKDGNMSVIRRHHVYYIPLVDSMGNRLDMDIAQRVDYILLHTEHSDIRWLHRVTGAPRHITGTDVRTMRFLTRGQAETEYMAYPISTETVTLEGFDHQALHIADNSFRPYFIDI